MRSQRITLKQLMNEIESIVEKFNNGEGSKLVEAASVDIPAIGEIHERIEERIELDKKGKKHKREIQSMLRVSRFLMAMHNLTCEEHEEESNAQRRLRAKAKLN